MLELLGLLGVLEDEGVKVALAADLELDLGGLLVLLYSGSWMVSVDCSGHGTVLCSFKAAGSGFVYVQEASLRLQISMNCVKVSIVPWKVFYVCCLRVRCGCALKVIKKHGILPICYALHMVPSVGREAQVHVSIRSDPPLFSDAATASNPYDLTVFHASNILWRKPDPQRKSNSRS